MKRVSIATIIALLAVPHMALAQDQTERLGVKLKAWLPANFRAGLADCSVLPSENGFAVSGSGQVSFGDGKGTGIDFAVAVSDGSPPTVAAHAINTKGTGTSGRTAVQSCALASLPRPPLPGVPGVGSSTPACMMSGDPDAPSLRFVVPLSAFGAASTAKSYVGHVSLIKRESGAAGPGLFVSKKGYDYYQSRSDMGDRGGTPGESEMRLVATCDTTGLSMKTGQPVKANYDLVAGKKV